MQPAANVEMEMQNICNNLKTKVAPQPESLEDLFKAQVRQNAVQHRVLKGAVVSSARDVIRRLLPELKNNSEYKKALEAELSKFSKIKIDAFIRMLECQVEESDFELEAEDTDWAIIPRGKEAIEFSIQLREYILSATNIPDPQKQRSSKLGKVAGAVGTGVWYTGWTLYQVLRVAFIGVQVGVAVAPLVPLAMLMLKVSPLLLL